MKPIPVFLALLAFILISACAPQAVASNDPAPQPSAAASPASILSSPTTAPAPSPTPNAVFTPQPTVTPPAQVTLFNRYIGRDVRRQPELIRTPPALLIPIGQAAGYSRSYIALFLNGKQVNGGEVLGNPEMLAQMIRLFDDAYKAGFTSQALLSVYRSYDEQLYLKQQNQNEQDEAVAEPGRSEHHLGTAFDLAWNAERLNFYLMTVYPRARDFYNWLKENAQRYGLVFSYPYKSSADGTRNNLLTGYVTEYKAEPWHLRYVGLELAEKIYAARDESGRNYLNPQSPLIPQQFMLP